MCSGKLSIRCNSPLAKTAFVTIFGWIESETKVSFAFNSSLQEIIREQTAIKITFSLNIIYYTLTKLFGDTKTLDPFT